MKLTAEQLIQDLIERTRLNSIQVEHFNVLSIEELNWKATPESWSILECLEHLNLYGDFYIPELKLRIDNSNTKAKRFFKPGFLGNYFAKSMLPTEKLNKMKTFKDKDPKSSTLERTTIERFILQQHQLLTLLEQAKAIDLNKTKTAISISPFLKLKLGDTFRVVVYHNERHLEQARKITLR